jgi:transcriptional repressor NrdR
MVGAAAMAALRSLDQIAYIRFASVYQSFEDLEDLKREVDALFAQRGSAGAGASGSRRLGGMG